jgi:hypothetical protein
MSTQTFTVTSRADLLRLVLVADAAVTGANAVAYIAGAPLLDSLLGVPAGALIAIGAFLAVFAGLVLRLATRPAIPTTGVVAVIAANVTWAVGSLAALAFDAFTPTTTGQVWIALQATVVTAFAALQWAGLRRA